MTILIFSVTSNQQHEITMKEESIKLTDMSPAFMTLVAAISTRDSIPFDEAIITAGNLLAEKEAA